MHLFGGELFTRDLAVFPLILVDVGARGGIHPRWRQVFPHIRVLAFEPGEETSTRNRGEDDAERVDLGLHGETGTFQFYMTRKPDASSMLRPNLQWLRRFGGSERYEVVGTSKIMVDTLDRQLAERGKAYVDFIKIDTQGNELAVLQGGRQALSQSVLGVEAEVNFGPRYEGQGFFSDVDAFLRPLGFQLFDIEPRYWKRADGARHGKIKGQLVYGNALYLRDAEGLKPLVSTVSDEKRARATVVHAIYVAIVYGYLDLCMEIFNTFGQCFSAAEKEAYATWARGQVSWSTRVPNFRGRKRAAHFFRSLFQAIKPVSANGSSEGDPLGNT